jgi:hypothetical protein
MARRKGKKIQRRRRKSGISLLNVAETVALSNVATQTLFNVNAYDFIVGGSNFQGGNNITLRELFNPNQTVTAQRPGTGSMRGSTYTANAGPTMGIVQANLRQNWVQGAIGMVTIPLGFRLAKQLGRPAISKMNALLRKAGVASTVKV